MPLLTSTFLVINTTVQPDILDYRIRSDDSLSDKTSSARGPPWYCLRTIQLSRRRYILTTSRFHATISNILDLHGHAFKMKNWDRLQLLVFLSRSIVGRSEIYLKVSSVMSHFRLSSTRREDANPQSSISMSWKYLSSLSYEASGLSRAYSPKVVYPRK